MNAATGSAEAWQEHLTIRSYDVDFRQRATLDALCRYFLEAAWNHAEALGFGYSHLAREQRFWVLARLRIEIAACPRWGDVVCLRTWPRAAKGILAPRDFEIVDTTGRQLVSGSSAWLVLDAPSRKPQRLDAWLRQVHSFPERMALGQDPAKLPAGQARTARLTVTSKYSDLDVNGHVNSARYLNWLLDSLPVEFHQAHDLKLIEVNYVEETRGGDVISVCSNESEPGNWSHALLRSSGTEVCRARSEWTTPPRA